MIARLTATLGSQTAVYAALTFCLGWLVTSAAVGWRCGWWTMAIGVGLLLVLVGTAGLLVELAGAFLVPAAEEKEETVSEQGQERTGLRATQ